MQKVVERLFKSCGILTILKRYWLADNIKAYFHEHFELEIVF